MWPQLRLRSAGRRSGAGRISVALPLLLGMVLSCGGGGGDRPQGGEGYFPHTNGFSWSYRITRPGADPATTVAVIDGTESVSGTTVQRMRVTSSLGSGQLLARITADSFLVYGANFFGSNIIPDPPLEVLSMPFELGDTFRGTSQVLLLLLPVTIRMDLSVEGFGAKSAGGRTYEDCFRFETTVSVSAASVSFEVPATIWVAPGVGAIAAEIDVPNNPFVPVSGHLSAELLDAGP